MLKIPYLPFHERRPNYGRLNGQATNVVHNNGRIIIKMVIMVISNRRRRHSWLFTPSQPDVQAIMTVYQGDDDDDDEEEEEEEEL